MRALLVEDDVAIAEPLASGLERQGFEVENVSTGGDALAASGYDIVLLDLGLPDMDGTDVCRELRARGDIPIIVISARAEELDRVLALELGADDYIVKPFGFRELVARIRAVMRRANAQPDAPSVVTEAGPLRIDRRAHRVTIGDEVISLTPREFDLLSLLAEDPGAVVTRDRIMDEVWDPNWYGSTRTMDVHIASLRKKLGDPGLVETIRGVGFRLTVEP